MQLGRRHATNALLVCTLLVLPLALHAGEPRVAGLHDLIVVEPGTHRNGGAAAVVDQSLPNAFSVDIPPTIHIHRYYYSGDREFQGPVIQGGPTVVVAGHPRTGERIYAEVTLPPGAPLISHTKRGITYVFSDRRVSVMYLGRRNHQVVVKYHSGRGVGRQMVALRKRTVSATAEHIRQSPTINSLRESVIDGGGWLLGAKDGMDSMTAGIIDGVRSISDAVPGVTAIKGYAQERPTRRYHSIVDRARREKDRASPKLVPTIR